MRLKSCVGRPFKHAQVLSLKWPGPGSCRSSANSGVSNQEPAGSVCCCCRGHSMHLRRAAEFVPGLWNHPTSCGVKLFRSEVYCMWSCRLLLYAVSIGLYSTLAMSLRKQTQDKLDMPLTPWPGVCALSGLASAIAWTLATALYKGID